MTDVFKVTSKFDSTHTYKPGTPCYQIPREMTRDQWIGKMNTLVTLLHETVVQQENRRRLRNRPVSAGEQ